MATSPGPAVVARVRKVLQQEFRALRKALEDYSTAPQPGSLFQIESAAWKTTPHPMRAHQRRLHQEALLQARLIVVNVLDHLRGADLLLQGGEWIPISSHMSLSRVTCEAATRVAYLLDPDVGYEVRTVRAAVMRMASEEANLTALRDIVRDQPELSVALAHAERTRDKVIDTITRAGITVHRDGKGRPSRLEVAHTGIKESTRVEAIALMAKYFPHRPAWYRMTSGITHSGAWMLDDTIVSAPTDPLLAVDPDFYGIGASGLLAVDASALVAQSYARYYGHDPAPFAQASAMRTRAIDLVMNEFASSG
ncbi:hypothetical protein ACIG5D_31970 [Microbispora rosea]|uniref:hypothetical protein n=1 Tax=Microbispora rosea TaxID=58117 RepID=UPI0037CBBB91